MNNTIVLVSLLLTYCFSFAQTDQINQQKYWKLRDDLREDFVKISDEPGGSIVARALKPNYCWNNLDAANPNTYSMGEMHFGDGMIRQGYYLGLLATEYKLLKNAGQDTRGVLNELYYVLGAINRNDLRAETEQSQIYGFFQETQLNGFYMREDIPEYFASQYWGNTDMRMYCVNSPHFNSNNAAQVNEAATPDHPVVLYAAPNSYQNVPSMDQLSSLMVGFQLVRQLVDNVYVQPTSSDEGKYVITETQAIVNRIMTYLNEHNWMMIDVNGWPVNNGGGDCVWAAYPLYYAALSITGNHYNADWDRRTESFYLSKLQYCITGFGPSNNTPEGQQSACDFVDIAGGLYGFADKQQLMQGIPAGPNNNQNHSAYQDWLATGSLHGGIGVTANFWTNPMGYLGSYPANVLSNFPLAPTFIDLVDIASDDSGTDSDNFGILTSNLAAASGMWTAASMHHITSQTGNIELDLVNAVLKQESPYESQTYYKNYLDEMSMDGPYNFPQAQGVSKASPNGWASEHRWTFASVEDGGSGDGTSVGIFNGLDYMLFHNLYRLAFPANQPVFTPETSEECYCGGPVSYTDASYPDQNTIGYLNDKLAHIHSCTENVFAKVNNQVTTNFAIAPYFPEYADMNIFTNEFQTENATVEATGHVDIQTPFILCNNATLNIKTNGVVKLNKKHVSVNAGSTVDISGEFYVHGKTKLVVKTGANLIIRPGGKLILHEDCSVVIEKGATLTYFKDAKIYTKNETGILEIKGNLNLQENATFNIDHSLSTISGCVLFTGNPIINAKPGVKFYLDSKGKTDPIVALSENTLVKFSDPDIVEVRLENCGIDLSKTNSSIRFEQPVYTDNMRFSGASTNAGKIYVTERNRFFRTEFVDMHLGAELDIENSSNLFVVQSSFTQTNASAQLATGISVLGMGYSITNSTFAIYPGGNAAVESSQLTTTSVVNGCTFNSTNSSIGSPAIYDVSNVQITVRSNTFNHLRNVIRKSLGTLVLKCDKFNNSYANSVTVSKLCHLNMSTSAGGGYNTFEAITGNSDRCHIFLQDATIDLFAGANYLKDVPVAGGLIRGKLLTPCTSASNCSLDFSGNQWNALPFLSPPTNRFAIQSSNNFTVQPNTLLPLPQANCGSLDVITPVIGAIKSLTLAQLGQLPGYFSPLSGQSVQLIAGIQLALSKMTALNDGSGNDLEAIERFNEIFASTINYSTSNDITRELFQFAQKNMKVALESAYDESYSNATAFENHVAMYLNALNKLTSNSITSVNYKTLFKLEMEKAHALRMIGQWDKEMDVLVHLENCGLNEAEQEIVNLEKSFIDRDLLIAQIGDQVIDEPAIVNPSPKIVPVVYAGPYKFGALIQGFNDFVYPECNDFKSLIVETRSDLTVFPNPVQTELNISFNKTFEASSLLEIMQLDGRLVYQSETTISIDLPTKIDVESWESGAYKIRVIHPDGTQQSATFVIR